MEYIMNSIITVLYFNGRVYEDNDGVIFEGSKKIIQIKRGISFNALKKKIGDKVKLKNNEIISTISCRFLVSGKYVALQICDDEDVETMIESFQQQQQMSVLELYVKKDIAGGSMFHAANFVTSCRRNVSHHESELPRNISNLHVDEHDDDGDYLASNSYVEESFDEDDSDDGISDTDDEVTDIVEPVSIVYQKFKIHFGMMLCIIIISIGVIRTRRTFVVWTCQRILMLDKELYVGMDFDNKDAVKNALKQYVMKVHQKSPCPFYMRAILSKKTDAWKVTQWGGPHTCLNMTMTQDHEKLDSNLIATCVVERINSEFSYKVSYKKAWMAKQKAIAIEYGDWEESYVKLLSWLTYMQNHSPGSYFQILHDDFIVGNRVSREHRQFHRVFWTFGQCKEAFKYCKPIIQVDGTHLYGKYRVLSGAKVGHRSHAHICSKMHIPPIDLVL
ncbi:hypothetical protein HKD37_11G031582 [Glycine soja]